MNITVQFDLPEPLANKARERGLLDPREVANLIVRELSSATDPRSFFEVARGIRSQPGNPMTAEEIQAEIDSVRAEGGIREAGH